MDMEEISSNEGAMRHQKRTILLLSQPEAQRKDKKHKIEKQIINFNCPRDTSDSSESVLPLTTEPTLSETEPTKPSESVMRLTKRKATTESTSDSSESVSHLAKHRKLTTELTLSNTEPTKPKPKATIPIETSDSSESVLRLTERKILTTEPTLSNTEPTKPKPPKGVVKQQNGHYGCQIYADNRRIWLGTFKTEAEAAAAYDSASIKLRSFHANSYRNFPLCDITAQEPVFQESYTKEAVLNMIRDGSYQHKFRDFLSIKSKIVENINRADHHQESNNCFTCTQLFQKELTPSDVGKLNRLVIPKKYAVKYMPFISDEQSDKEGVEDVEVVCYDRAMRPWKFRYCYWRSSQSFVFTRGWNGFVKEKNLKEKDIIVFCTCNVPKTLEGQSKNFLMIDVVPEEVNKTVQGSTSDEEVTTQNLLSPKLEDKGIKSEEKKGVLKLFGFMIQL